MKLSLPSTYFKLLFFIQLIIICTFINPKQVKAQGCVAVRHMSTCTNTTGGTNNLAAGQWQLSLGYRWLYSHRHFVGTTEQKHRIAENTEVINATHSVDISTSYSLTNRLSFNLVIPVSYTDRSSLYEHLGNNSKQRFHTQSQGLGDMRVSASYWLLNPEKHMDGNIALGLGIKAPTGNYNVQDDFHRPDGIERRPVDQSMQLGDGGWGITFEMQAYQKLFNRAYGYVNGFYLMNPRNTNGTKTFRRDSVQIGSIISVMSVADQYLARAGMTYNLLPAQGISVSLGGRIEGIPAWDIIGGSEGFRRPGYIVSVDPGINYMKNKNNLSLNVPVALVRNRIKSVSDIRRRGHGDAAFADYFITATYARRF
jgi:hypothetical protein